MKASKSDLKKKIREKVAQKLLQKKSAEGSDHQQYWLGRALSALGEMDSSVMELFGSLEELEKYAQLPPEVKQATEELDRALGSLEQGLKNSGL